ncbi:2-oxoglutarate dehydrogenase complex dihydrolipoyllysine-residue succinyltransferase [Halieaceae bacterium IMCC14734]|uniref:Dihydrolipoyllysine-residue succinyltransferase component of 2-oxoglutarate dehydrogenase complex n=1 Tax=Candidatus Litorirhabdus singularis TaxID=2518993 RepID=A0ABT3TGP0_9GAMM|nr:2-oxoglutarate dehydrogenase complex dihydrolipoyllysine-residue succinyltransferase [Candidatus Litorirhabdus singularis]MCX2981477.1 2-oxoglutarate dehydrogenase complex dihydrolipoyllysine-residue succinyltransferase [Candidatus Litorirhabdus singularis]
MAQDIKAPSFPESVADGEIAVWHKAAGDPVQRDELLVEIETDKVVMEVVAPFDGVLTEIVKPAGEVILSDEVIGRLEEGKVAKTSPAPVAAPPGTPEQPAADDDGAMAQLGPAARRMAEEEGVDLAQVVGTGRDGRITKDDLLKHIEAARVAPTPVPAAPAQSPVIAAAEPGGDRLERRVPMTRMRKRIAERLLSVSRETAMLTTFNEVNMAPVMALRGKYKEQFQGAHNGTRLGFMGFFVKAACEALKRFPVVNASIDGDDIVYHGYQDVGVAVSTENGLVVPVLRDADFMSMADIEARIADFGGRARNGKLSIEDMTGGTFTITNGGVFGSLLSTPILNPPQTGILGMHKIQDRPMAVDGEVVIQPMMYLALSYDHRLVDGKDAVQFLASIKDFIEDPARILLQL